MCNNECVSDGKCNHNEECYEDFSLTREQVDYVDNLIRMARADERRKFVDWLNNGLYLLTKVEDVWCGHYFGVKEVEVDFYEVLAEYEKKQK